MMRLFKSPEHMYSGQSSCIQPRSCCRKATQLRPTRASLALAFLINFFWASMVHFSFAMPAVRASLCTSWPQGLLVEGTAARLPSSHWAHQVHRMGALSGRLAERGAASAGHSGLWDLHTHLAFHDTLRAD